MLSSPSPFLAPSLSEPSLIAHEIRLANHLAQEDDLLRLCLFGARVLKCGRLGNPHYIYFYLDLDGTLYWTHSEATFSEVGEKKAAYRFSKEKSLQLGEAKYVETGKKTEVWKRKIANGYDESVCLSIVWADRTFDIALETKEKRDLWASALQFALRNLRVGRQIGLLDKRMQSFVEKPSDVKLKEMLKTSASRYGADHRSKQALLPPVNLRTRDNTDRIMFGLETVEEADQEVAAFKKQMEDKRRLEQFSWDCACIFDAGSTDILTIPKVEVSKRLPKLKKEKVRSRKAREMGLDDERNGREYPRKHSSFFGLFGTDEASETDASELGSDESHGRAHSKSLEEKNGDESDDPASDVNETPHIKQKSRATTKSSQDIKLEDDEEINPPAHVDVAALDGAIGVDIQITENELFTRTTAQLIQSFQAAGLRTCVYSISHPERIVCLIGATEQRLEEEAARIAYDLQLDNIACMNYGVEKGMPLAYYTKIQSGVNTWGTVYVPFLSFSPANPKKHMLYRRWSEPPYRINSFFQSADRIKLISSIIESSHHSCARAPIHHFVHHPHHSLMAYFPLDSNLKRNELFETWVSWRSLATLGISTVVSPPLDSIRTYFGEHVACYVAFLSYTCLWLALPSCVGIIVWLYQAISNEVGSVPWDLFFGIFTAGFSIVFVKIWNRFLAEYRVDWGIIKSTSRDVVRPEFWGSWIQSGIDGRHQRRFYWYQRAPWYVFTYLCVAACCLGVMAMVVGILILRSKLVASQGDNAAYFASIINAIQISLTNKVFDYFVRILTELENHQYQREFDNSLLIKSFIFKFINCYGSLFFIAFFQPYDPWVPECLYDQCLAQIRQHLGCLVITQVVLVPIMDYLLPWLASMTSKIQFEFGGEEVDYQLRKYRDFFAADASAMEGGGFLREETAEDQFNRVIHNIVPEMEYLLFQFGYATLFAITFPLAPAICLVCNFVGIRTFARRVCRMYRRPEPQGIENMFNYFLLFQIMSGIAIVTNLALVLFSTSFFVNYVPLEPEFQVLAFVVVEHILLTIAILMILGVSDVPRHVKDRIARRKVLIDVLLYGKDEERDLTTLPFIAPASASNIVLSDMSTDDRVLEQQLENVFTDDDGFSHH